MQIREAQLWIEISHWSLCLCCVGVGLSEHVYQDLVLHRRLPSMGSVLCSWRPL